jgi:hypothetical protein
MTLLADVAHDHITFWWITLGLGAVVIAVVIVLLSLLVALVADIDRNVKEAWQTATRVARNTATTWMLTQAGQATDQLREEVDRHARLLTGGGRR